ncbi:MAG: hypothetical protein J5685_06475 [Clostridiales bacterium]|nr:hypothetical protein [Clostridiales bacterium]
MKENRLIAKKFIIAAMAAAMAGTALTGCGSVAREGSSRGRDDSAGTEVTEDEEVVDTELTEYTVAQPEPNETEVTENETGAPEVTEETTEDTGAEETEAEPEEYIGVSPDDLDIPGGYRRIEETTFSDGSTFIGHEFYYDANGNEVLESYVNEDGELAYSHYYEYDDEGNLVKEIMWNSTDLRRGVVTDYEYGEYGINRVTIGSMNGEAHYYHTYDYDEQGRVSFIHMFVLPADGEIEGYEFVYNEDGSYTRYYWSSASGEYCRSEVTWNCYDAHGNLIEDYSCPLGTVDRTVYTYDENDNLIHEEDLHGESRRYRGGADYEYDDQGRLVRRTRYYDNGNVSNIINYTYEPV